jgi:hypothetical protein
MTKQKHGFLVFLASLIPGGGELYMGFQKIGLSLMVLFFGCLTLCTWISFDALIYLLPVVWFYSFFETHHLSSLSPEEFHCVEDHYLFSIEGFRSAKYRKQFAILLAVIFILIGIMGLWNLLMYNLEDYISDEIFDYIEEYASQIPPLLISILLIILGIKLIINKKEAVPSSDELSATQNSK